MFNPSPQQQTIFDRIASASENLIIEAVAGSGKTTTIVEGIKHIPANSDIMPPSVVFLAFNKNIAETLRSKCPSGTTCSTFHSLGFSALKNSGLVKRNVRVDGRKCSKLVWDRTDKDDEDTRNIIKLVSLGKTVPKEHLNYSEFQELAIRYDVPLENEQHAIAMAQEVLNESNSDLDVIDFDDMLYLPVINNVRFEPFDWIFVDEAQDTNDVQLEILDRLQKLGRIEESPIDSRLEQYKSPSRLIAVGDSHQAIYGFRGANSDSMTRIAKRFGCNLYRLSVSYRCSKMVAREAQKVLK